MAFEFHKNSEFIVEPKGYNDEKGWRYVRYMDKQMTDEEFDDYLLTTARIKERYFAEEYPKVKERVRELRQEVLKEDRNFYRVCRMEYLNLKADEIIPQILDLRALKKKHPDFFIWEKELVDLEKKMEGYLNNYRALGEDSIREADEDTIERCRQYPVIDLEPLNELHLKPNSFSKVCCPFHSEKTPSFCIYADNTYHCFGCGAHGLNAIDYVVKYYKKNFKEAVQFLKEKL